MSHSSENPSSLYGCNLQEKFEVGFGVFLILTVYQTIQSKHTESVNLERVSIKNFRQFIFWWKESAHLKKKSQYFFSHFCCIANKTKLCFSHIFFLFVFFDLLAVFYIDQFFFVFPTHKLCLTRIAFDEHFSLCIYDLIKSHAVAREYQIKLPFCKYMF